MKTLHQLTQEISETYADLSSFVVQSEIISFTESGLLNTGKSELPLTLDGSRQFARRSKIPAAFLLRQEADLRAIILN